MALVNHILFSNQILTEVSTSKVITQPSELTSTARAVTQPPGPEPTSTANTVTQPPEPQPIVKEWHHEITLTIREHLITKFTKLYVSDIPFGYS